MDDFFYLRVKKLDVYIKAHACKHHSIHTTIFARLHLTKDEIVREIKKRKEIQV